MKHTHRIVPLILVLAVSAGLIASCGPDAGESSEEEIIVEISEKVTVPAIEVPSESEAESSEEESEEESSEVSVPPIIEESTSSAVEQSTSNPDPGVILESSSESSAAQVATASESSAIPSTGGTPKMGDRKSENGKEYVYVTGFGWKEQKEEGTVYTAP